jgi:hypothetical protein
MDDLEELIARNRIHRLAVRYALAVDGKAVDSIAAVSWPGKPAVLRSKVGEQADRGDRDTGFVSGAPAASGG